jgi:hypothetical protein
MCVCIEVAPRVPEWLVASLVRIHCWQLQQLIGSQWCRECVTGRASFVEETKQNGGEAINLKKTAQPPNAINCGLGWSSSVTMKESIHIKRQLR